VHPRQELLGGGVRRGERLAGGLRRVGDDRGDLWLAPAQAQRLAQMLARIRKQHVAHEGDVPHRAFDIEEERLDHDSYFGTVSAILSPVNVATQPSGVVNRRIAAKRGLGPMSNQCRVCFGTDKRSPCSHTTFSTVSSLRK